MKSYIFNLLMGLSQLLNALLGGRPKQSFSGRVGIAAHERKTWGIITARVINGIFFFHPNHCHKSIDWSEAE